MMWASQLGGGSRVICSNINERAWPVRAAAVRREIELLDLFRHKSVISFNGPYSGLGNRIRVVLGAKMLADSEGREFYYVWPTGRSFGRKLTAPWHFAARPLPRPLSRLLSSRYPYLDKSFFWLDAARRESHVWQ